MSEAPSFETLDLKVDGPVGILSLNRPKARNAIDNQMRSDLRDAIDHIASDLSIRGLVLTGAGSAFCSGGDIKGMQERLDQGQKVAELGWRRQREFHETLHKLYNLDRPTVAAVNGSAFGLGLDLALTCDLVFFADTTTVAANFVRRGLIPDGGGMFHLPRRVGVSRAKELIFSGRNVAAEEALAIGLADRVLPGDQLVAAAVDWLKGCAEHPPMAQALAKGVLNRSLEISFDEVSTLGNQAQAICYASPEHQDSVRVFLAERAQAQSAKA
jgi:enoyl-CoA hydratase/carnithine racemase